MKKRILFVDDEVAVLDGLRSRLHRQRSRWDMVFATSGEAAMRELEREAFDVIVSDMRMPGMDGAALLTTASQRWPHMVRIVLSGYAEQEITMRLVPVAHQYLSKPCDANQVENVIARCLDLQSLLIDPNLRALVGSIKDLPTLPRTYVELRNAMAREDVDIHEITRIVAADTVIAAKVLQVVNSAFFRLARPISKIEQAVMYLGFGAIRNLAMSAGVFSQWHAAALPADFDPERAQAHAHAVAGAARALTHKTGMQDDALLAGLLHDLGHLLLALKCPREVERANELSRSQRVPLHLAEREVFGASHAQLGAYLLGIWGLPYPIVEAVAYHHTAHEVQQTQFDLLAALVVGHELVRRYDPIAGSDPLGLEPPIGDDYLRKVNANFDWQEAQALIATDDAAGATGT